MVFRKKISLLRHDKSEGGQHIFLSEEDKMKVFFAGHIFVGFGTWGFHTEQISIRACNRSNFSINTGNFIIACTGNADTISSVPTP